MKTTIIVLIIATILFFVTGCGPGEPFEIEGIYTPQSETPVHVAAAG